jgi:hypothetical protein
MHSATNLLAGRGRIFAWHVSIALQASSA